MKRLELQNFGVQELDAKEVKEMNGGMAGGFWGFVFDYALGKVIELSYEDWKSRYGNQTHATQTGHYASMGPY